METTIAGPAPRGPVLVALACALLWAGPVEGQERIELRRAVPPGTYLKVWNGAGSVEVEAWDRDSLVVTGTRSSEAGSFFHSVGDSLGKVGFYADTAREEMVGGELLVRVPASSSVWVKVASADVAVRGSEGSVDVFSVSGSVDVEGSPRTVHVESMTGSVRLALGATDVVRVRGGAGDVTVRGRVLDLSASTVDGAVEARHLRTRRASLETVDGSVTFRGVLGRGGRLSAETHSGDVELVLPPEVDAAFDLATVEGEIDDRLDGGRGTPSTAPGSRRSFEIGAGEAEIRARTFSGDIRVRTSSETSDEREP